MACFRLSNQLHHNLFVSSFTMNGTVGVNPISTVAKLHNYGYSRFSHTVT